MTEPFARPISGQTVTQPEHRTPKAFVPAKVEIIEAEPDFESSDDTEIDPAPLPRRMTWLGRLAWG